MLRKLFIWGNVALLVLFIAAVVQDLAGPYFPGHWAQSQMAYRKMQADAESNAETKKVILNRGIEIKQIQANDLGQIDRCTSCHQGMDSIATPTLQNSFMANPFKSHPGDFLKNHSPDKFGCVTCHGGQGIATTFLGAGHQPKDETQKAEWKKKYGWEPTVMAQHGCMGCHQWKGVGGPISVDLAEETSNKPLGRIDFSHTGLSKEDMNLLNWIRLHFVKDPAEMTPGDPEAHFNTEPIAPSGMQNYTQPSAAYPDKGPELSENDATALTTYILSARSDKIPYNYYIPGPKEAKFEDMHFSSRKEAGKWVYDRYGCAACHGLNAKGGRRNFNYQGGGLEPVLVKTVSNYTRDELRKKIEYGVPVVNKENEKGPTPPLYMPPWKDRISHDEMEALMDYLFSIAEKQAEF